MTAPNVLLATKGHPFQRDPFFSMFDSFQQDGAISAWTHVEQPAAQLFFDPVNAAPYDVIVDYSMPGRGIGTADPPQSLKDGYRALVEEGKGMVMIHHNICSWPAWEEYAEMVGGRFFYDPGELRGQDWPDSGYLLAVNHTVTVAEPEHPVVKGLEPQFELQDELYLAPYFEDNVVPLLRSDGDDCGAQGVDQITAVGGPLDQLLVVRRVSNDLGVRNGGCQQQARGQLHPVG